MDGFHFFTTHGTHFRMCVYTGMYIQMPLTFLVEDTTVWGGCYCFLLNITHELSTCGKSLESEPTKCYKLDFIMVLRFSKGYIFQNLKGNYILCSRCNQLKHKTALSWGLIRNPKVLTLNFQPTGARNNYGLLHASIGLPFLCPWTSIKSKHSRGEEGEASWQLTQSSGKNPRIS